jgi:hypothetical protein
MAYLTLGQKAERLLKLLLGLGNRRALAALQARGFQQSDMDEGWALLKKVVDVRFDAMPAEASSTIVEEVDSWENKWFSVIDATLRRSFPEIHAQVLLNLSQTDGPPVILSVSTLLQRLDALRAASDEPSKAAIAKLEQRGVTTAVLDEVRKLIASAATVTQPVVVAPISTEEAAELAQENEEAMWAYYLEWSAIARSAIKDKRLLRVLGFSPVRRSKADDASDDDAAEPVEPAQPAITNGGAKPAAQQSLTPTTPID